MKYKSLPIFLLLGSLIINCGSRRTILVDDWIIDIDPGSEVMNVSHKKLGTILSEMKLYVGTDSSKSQLSEWSVKTASDGLTITAAMPYQVVCQFILDEDNIFFRTSHEKTFLSARTPAPANRFPARVAVPENMMVQHTGQENDYTGVDQIEKFYVPEENPQVLYLSLGSIDAPFLFSLFDKDSNTVIQFTKATELVRRPENPSMIQVLARITSNERLVHLIRNYYTDVLGMPNYVPYNDTYHKSAPTGWNHWLAFYRQVTEKDIVDHADFISRNLKPYGMLHCQLDDGYDHPDRRLWDRNWDPKTFPNGPEWLARYIKGKGLIPGLWTVPYCYSVRDADPDWFLRDDEGNILMDYQGGGELDFSRPEVIQEYWIPLWRELKRQGWEYYKFDMGNTSRMWFRYQHNFSDTSKSSYTVSHETMDLFREIMGREIWYTNHPDVYGGRMGYIDVAGCGRDPGPGWKAMNNFLEVISNNAYQNHIVWYSDPDCIVLRGKPTRADTSSDDEGSKRRNRSFLTLEEARTCASMLCLSGMQYLNGDDLLNLENDRLDIIKKTIPTLPIYPIDLFGRSRDRGHYPEIMDLKINAPAGKYDVIAVTNWQDSPADRKVSINTELCLKNDVSYLLFDSWKEQFAGEYSDTFRVSLPAHGTCVYTVHRNAGHPLLLATNRHVTGAVSIRKNLWDPSERTLSGISESVTGAEYALFIYVPRKFTIDSVHSGAEDLKYDLGENGLLTVRWTGQEKPVEWMIRFTEKQK
jgi:hypothetical protein